MHALYQGQFQYAAAIEPDEMGVWTYEWRTRPDARFGEQSNGGWFTVVRGSFERHARAIEAAAGSAIQATIGKPSPVVRMQTRFRLESLERETGDFLRQGGHPGSLHDVLDKIRRALAAVE